MDSVNLIKLIVTWEEGNESQDFEKDTASAPAVHLISVVAVSQKAFGCSVPSRRDVFCERLLGVKPSAASKICDLKSGSVV